MPSAWPALSLSSNPFSSSKAFFFIAPILFPPKWSKQSIETFFYNIYSRNTKRFKFVIDFKCVRYSINCAFHAISTPHSIGLQGECSEFYIINLPLNKALLNLCGWTRGDWRRNGQSNIGNIAKYIAREQIRRDDSRSCEIVTMKTSRLLPDAIRVQAIIVHSTWVYVWRRANVVCHIVQTNYNLGGSLASIMVY